MKYKYCFVKSYRNKISEWAAVVRYENFFNPGATDAKLEILSLDKDQLISKGLFGVLKSTKMPFIFKGFLP